MTAAGIGKRRDKKSSISLAIARQADSYVVTGPVDGEKGPSRLV